MSKMRIRKGDFVRIISGKDKGKEGKVLRRMLSGGMVLAEGINIVTSILDLRRKSKGDCPPRSPDSCGQGYVGLSCLRKSDTGISCVFRGRTQGSPLQEVWRNS